MPIGDIESLPLPPVMCVHDSLYGGDTTSLSQSICDKGHYHILPCLSGRALCERSLGPYRVNLRRGVSRVRSGQRRKLGIFFMT
jgi:hypothetical protein